MDVLRPADLLLGEEHLQLGQQALLRLHHHVLDSNIRHDPHLQVGTQVHGAALHCLQETAERYSGSQTTGQQQP